MSHDPQGRLRILSSCFLYTTNTDCSSTIDATHLFRGLKARSLNPMQVSNRDVSLKTHYAPPDIIPEEIYLTDYTSQR